MVSGVTVHLFARVFLSVFRAGGSWDNGARWLPWWWSSHPPGGQWGGRGEGLKEKKKNFPISLSIIPVSLSPLKVWVKNSRALWQQVVHGTLLQKCYWTVFFCNEPDQLFRQKTRNCRSPVTYTNSFLKPTGLEKQTWPLTKTYITYKAKVLESVPSSTARLLCCFLRASPLRESQGNMKVFVLLYLYDCAPVKVPYGCSPGPTLNWRLA